ncbi:DUF4410 domain-containing protein [Paraburkholderia sp.]|jgi:hypothetical protein|uniref:DUF4410 domain-containing protein n=1 Tax=Paraburkholderia sp. TaxID=1926495 RepID=UPI002F3FECC4
MVRQWLQPVLAAVCLSAMTTASLAAAGNAPFPNPPPVVYVANFDLDVANVKPDSGPGSRLRRFGVLPGGPLRPSKDPQEHAEEIVGEMADDLTADLKQAGVDARRVTPGQPLPATGWQVRGVFLSVDEGNRLQRAMVGLGAGQNDFQVAVSLDDLSTPDLPPLYQQTEEGTSKDKPGAFIKLNPYVIAAKFVMAGHDEKSTIKSTAKQISDAVAEKLKARLQQ